MSAMMPLTQQIEQGGKFIQCVKQGLNSRKLPVGPPRKPLQALSEDDWQEMERVISVMHSTFEQINDA